MKGLMTKLMGSLQSDPSRARYHLQPGRMSVVDVIDDVVVVVEIEDQRFCQGRDMT